MPDQPDPLDAYGPFVSDKVRCGHHLPTLCPLPAIWVVVIDEPLPGGSVDKGVLHPRCDTHIQDTPDGVIADVKLMTVELAEDISGEDLRGVA